MKSWIMKLFCRPAGKNQRDMAEHFLDSSELVSGRPEAKCFFRPVVFFPAGRGLTQSILHSTLQLPRTGREKQMASGRIFPEGQATRLRPAGGKVFFPAGPQKCFFRPAGKKQFHITRIRNNPPLINHPPRIFNPAGPIQPNFTFPFLPGSGFPPKKSIKFY